MDRTKCALEGKVVGLTSNTRELTTHLWFDIEDMVLQKDQVNISNTAKTYQGGDI